MSERILNVAEVTRLDMVLQAAQRGARVARALPGGLVASGTARHIVRDEGFNFARPQDDVRDCFLRVTLDGGFDALWPVQELADAIAAGTFSPDYS